MNIEQYRKNNKKQFAALRKALGIKVKDRVEPGSFIKKANDKKTLSKKDVAIRGLI